MPGEKGERGEQGAQGEPGEQGETGVLPVVKVWAADTVYYRAEVVTRDGGTYQAQRDTGQPPPHADWITLAKPGADGRSPTVRGTFSATESYKALDIVAFNGGSFIARQDEPGECPGAGWQLIASPGKRGDKGQPGPRGERGEQGERGEAAPIFLRWEIDHETYTAVPLMSDGEKGPPLELRGLFEQFHSEAR